MYQAPFEEKHRHYFEFQRRSGQLPVQKEVSLDLDVESLSASYFFSLTEIMMLSKHRVKRWIIEVSCTVMAPF